MFCEQVHQIDIRNTPPNRRSRSYNPILGIYEAMALESTKNGYGKREWYLCPHCNHRCAILYAKPHYACRKCHGLHYAIEHETIADRAIRTAIKHREKYGLHSGGVAAPFPSKPKLMRWHTYLRALKDDKQNLANVCKTF